MAVVYRVTEEQYRELAMSDPDAQWELWNGVPMEKPGMSVRHNRTASLLGYVVQNQLDFDAYIVQANSSRLWVAPGRTFIPDLVVIPVALQRAIEDASLEVYTDPLPLVVEVWSPSTGAYDVAVKLQGYQERGDAEIWYVHPIERRLTVWRRRPDGGYDETTVRGSVVAVASLPDVRVDLDALFDGRRPQARA